MSTLLLINPNTSWTISELLRTHAQAAAGPGVEVRLQTARFGAPYIACEASYAVAAHAALDGWARALVPGERRFDAVLIGCFGDPGLHALREAAAAPVTGLAEASFIAAARLGRFAIVTGGERWKPMLERLALGLGFGTALAGIEVVPATGAQLAADPVAAQAVLAEACAAALRRFDGVQSLILGGAGLAGMAARIQPGIAVPVIDSVTAGVSHALGLAAQQPDAVQALPAFDFAWRGVSPELGVTGRI